MKHILSVSLVILLTCQNTAGQITKIKSLQIGDKVPENIWKTIPRKPTTKLVILDFWATWCLSCIDAFPTMEKLQKDNSEKLQIVYINSYQTCEQIKNGFNRINKNKYKDSLLQIPSNIKSITGDKTYRKLFPHNSIPHHVWLDKEGKVLEITSGENATDGNVKAIIAGKNIKMFYKEETENTYGIGLFKGVLQPSNPSISTIYYSAFFGYCNFSSSGGTVPDSTNGTFRFYSFNMPIIEIYRSSLTANNETRNRIIIEVSNKALLTPPTDINLKDAWRKKNTYSYELQGPIKEYNNPNYRVNNMAIDANQFFGSLLGIEGLVEKRRYKSLVLIKTGDISAMKTSGGEPKYSGPSIEGHKDGLILINKDFEELINVLKGFENMAQLTPFLDETGIDENMKIDITLTGEGYLENVRNQLNNYGLDIIEAEREVEVIVIRDKK